MSYKALKAFRHSSDANRYYATGDLFPHRKAEVTEEQIQELVELGFVGPNQNEVMAESVEPEQEIEYEEIDLDKLTKAELVELAKEHDIEFTSKDTKEDLIQKLSEV